MGEDDTDAAAAHHAAQHGSQQNGDALTDAGGNASKQISIREKLQDPEYKRSFLQTIWLGASFFVLGFTVSQRGPAFLDLQIITRTDVEQASFFFTANSVGHLAGSLMSGVIYDKLNKSLLVLLVVVGLAVSTAVLPWCSVYGLMIAINFVVAVFQGAVDTVGNAELVRIWGKEGEMAMQFIHFGFALGGVIAPLVTEPFLTPNPDDLDPDALSPSNTSTGVTTNWMEMASSTYPSNMSTSLTPQTEELDSSHSSPAQLPLTTDVHYAFMISGGIGLLVAIPLTVQLLTDRVQKRRQKKRDENNVKQPLPMALFLFVQIFLCLFYFLYCAVEDAFSAYLAVFVVKQLNWSKSEAAQLSSVFWAAFASGRFLCIFIVRVLNSARLLFVSCLALVLSMLAFFLMSEHDMYIGIWVFTAFLGASMAGIFPTGFTWMEEELVRVTGRVTSSIVISSSSGTMSNPILLGYLMQQLTPMWFCYLFLGESVLCLGTFLFLLALSRLYVRKHYTIHEAKTAEKVVLNPDVAETADHRAV